MAKKVIAVIMIVIMFTITVQAEILAPVENPPAFIAGRYQAQGSNNVGYTTYPSDTQWYKVDALAGQVPFIAKWYSLLQENHIYKVVIDVTEEPIFPGWEYIEGTGVIAPSEYLYVGQCGLDAFPNIDLSESAYGTEQWLKQVDTTKINKFDPSTYTFFVDKTNKYIAILFVATPENIADWVSSYLFISMGTMQFETTGRWYTEFQPFELQDNQDYKSILQEISEKLDNMSGGGGLSQEQINEAIQDALTAHDQALENQGNELLGDASEQLEEHFGKYFDAAGEIRQSLAGISDALSYSGTDGMLVLPEARNPMADNALLWTRKEIDLVAAWNGIPQALRSVVSIVVTMSILTAIAKEVLSILEMWNTEKDLFGR